MRIQRLSLLAFGPFTDVELDLSRPDCVHLVYGPNEAGKSTTLRALAGLLFGIPERSSDAHLHALSRLRVGGVLETSSGERLEIVRRKGRKNTLLDADEQPVEEAVLQAVLAGLSRERFLSVFGLDHDSLRQGAEALLGDRGDVGESLFDAGLGGPGVRRLLEQLEQEAERIFTPRASTRDLNVALKEYKDVKKRGIEAALRPLVWREQSEEIERLRAETERLRGERVERTDERLRLRRLRQLLPLLRRHDELVRRRDELGGHEVLDRLLALPSEVVADLRSRLGSHHRDAAERPRSRTLLEATEEQIRASLRELGQPVPLEAAASLHVEAAEVQRIRSLARKHESLRARLDGATEQLREAELDLQHIEARRAELPPAGDATPLERAVELGGPLVELEQRVQEEEQALARMMQQAQAVLDSLPGWSGTPAQAATLPCPLAATVERFEAEMAEQAAQRRHLQALVEQLDPKLRSVETERAAEARIGDVPTEQGLAASREQRDVLWQSIRSQAKHPDDVAAEFEAAMQGADELADRLRREAGRVARHAELEARREALLQERDDYARRAEALDEAAQQQARAWQEAWAPAQVAPASPREMKAWLDQRGEARRLLEEHAARAEVLGRQRERVRREGALLESLLDGEVAPPGGATAFERLERARARLKVVQARQAEEAALDGEERKARDRRQRLQHQRKEAAAQLAEWHRAWSLCMQALGLAADALPEQAEAVLEERDRLAERVQRAADLRAEIQASEQEARQFEADVHAAVERCAPELAGRSVDEQTLQLERRHGDAQRLRGALQAVQEELGAVQGGASLDELRALARETSEAEADARLEEVEAEIERLDDDLDAAKDALRSSESGLRELEQRESADLAELADGHLSRVRDLTQQYLRLRVAAFVLRREVERYREENQDPILQRAAALFPRLTLQSFESLRTRINERDEQELVCIRPGGQEVSIDGLSTGARDQLYLALRVAALERHAGHDEPIPFVIDDVLIHFDDDRARAALEILAELSTRVQILFFTHHQRIVELARDAIGSRLEEHQLAAPAVGRSR